jgi:hypothetical protein
MYMSSSYRVHLCEPMGPLWTKGSARHEEAALVVIFSEIID